MQDKNTLQNSIRPAFIKTKATHTPKGQTTKSMNTKKYTAIIIAAILAAGCAKTSHTVEDDHEEHLAEGEIHFTPQQAANAGLQTQKATLAPFAGVIRCGGSITPAPDDASEIIAPASGIVTYAVPALSDGYKASAGETIFHITSRTIGSGDAAYKARAAYKAAQAQYQRAKTPKAEKLITATEYEQAELDYRNAEAAYHAAGGTTSDTRFGTAVQTPSAGYLSNITITNGSYIQEGMPLATLSKNRKLQLKAEVEKNHYRELNKIRSANFHIPYDDATYKLADMNGRLITYGRASTPQSNYLPVIFQFDNNGDILPGTYAEIFLLTEGKTEAIAIPEKALVEESGIYYIYLRIHDDIYRRQQVTTGRNDGERVEILTGVAPGDEVVTDGVHQLKQAALGNIIPEGHTHAH